MSRNVKHTRYTVAVGQRRHSTQRIYSFIISFCFTYR